jgi:general secretion pathway protein L
MTLTSRSSVGIAALRRFLAWWSSEISDMLASRANSADVWQVMFLRREAGSGCDVYLRSRKSIEQVGTSLEAGEQLREQLRRRLGNGKIPPSGIVLRLHPSEVVQTRISVPAAARGVMEPILRNQIERLAPWPADKALFAYEVAGEANEAGALDVKVAVASRGAVDGLVAELGSLGYRPGVVDYGADSTAPPRMNLLPRREQAPEGPGQLIVSAIAIVLAVSLVVGAAGGVLYGVRVAEMNDIATRLEALGSARKSALRGGDAASEARKLAWLASQKADQPSMALTLEALSRALPDEAWLNRLEVGQGAVTIAGSATSADRLVGLLEASRHFSDVQFSAPITRADGETLDTFTITAKIVAGQGLR